jgi:hypothetical protein
MVLELKILEFGVRILLMSCVPLGKYLIHVELVVKKKHTYRSTTFTSKTQKRWYPQICAE